MKARTFVRDRIEPAVDAEAVGASSSLQDVITENEHVVEPAVGFPSAELAALYQRIRAGHPAAGGVVVQVIGAQRGVGVTSVTQGIGAVAAELSSQRVLVCDATGQDDLLRLNRLVIRRSLPTLAAYSGLSVSSGVIACPLDVGRTPSEMLANVPEYAEALKKVRDIFDLIVIDAPAFNTSGVGIAMAKYVDATVIVVQADQTREPLISALVDQLKGAGGTVAGLVLNKRVLHIPRFVYRWL